MQTITLNSIETMSLLFIATIALVTIFYRKSLISDNRYMLHALGMALNMKNIILFTAAIVSIFVVKRVFDNNAIVTSLYYPAIVFSYLTYILCTLQRFVKAFSLDNRQKDSYNHLLQTSILVSIAIFGIYMMVHFGINEKSFMPFSLFAAIVGLIFNDSIKGVVAYYHLRANKLLHIGDWIEVPAQNIEGEIVEISLVTVTVKNSDNTLTNIPIQQLQNGSFKNSQNLFNGIATGRRMYRTFNIDTRSIKSMSTEDVKKLKEKFEQINEDTIIFTHFEPDTHSSLNIHLYRRYLTHWLMNNSHLTRHPRLIVCLLQPTSEGLPMQVYTYILKTDKMSFEQVQSSVSEHILMSMEWFGLRLYQKPTGEDIINMHNN